MKITDLRFVTEKRAKEFAKLNIRESGDLIRFFPRAYLDMTSRVSVFSVPDGETALFAARLIGAEPVRRKGSLKILRAWLEQDGEAFTAVWFNMPYLASRMKEGEYLFYGRIQNRYGQFSVVTQRAVREAVSSALKAEKIESAIPPVLREKYRLSDLQKAYFTVHNPQNQGEMYAAAERIALEEYFTLVSAFKLVKGDRREPRRRIYSVTERDVAAFERRFPFFPLIPFLPPSVSRRPL